MTLSWPWALLVLLVIPLVLAAAWLTRRRRRRAAETRRYLDLVAAEQAMLADSTAVGAAAV